MQDQMRYDELARDALRGVVREALRRAADEGLPGRHHFYISFLTRAPGVDLDPELMERHPHDMTIVLEHQFWDLAVDEDSFEVTLKFKGVPKYIRVPFAAVAQFHDPSVGFTLRFDTPLFAPTPQAGPGTGPSAAPPAPAKAAPPKPVAAPKAQPRGADQPRPAEGGAQVVKLESFRKKPD